LILLFTALANFSTSFENNYIYLYHKYIAIELIYYLLK